MSDVVLGPDGQPVAGSVQIDMRTFPQRLKALQLHGKTVEALGLIGQVLQIYGQMLGQLQQQQQVLAQQLGGVAAPEEMED